MSYTTPSKFLALCERHGIPSTHAKQVFEELVTHYAEAQRAYHTLEHIDYMLQAFVTCKIPDDEIEFAIWFHDAIYKPGEAHHERKSADYFVSKLGGYLWTEFSAEVERLIIATDHGIKRKGTYREDIIIDIDLSILGAQEKEYDHYAKLIRDEYYFVSDSDFSKGRKKLLNSLLEENIFATRYFRPLEQQARENIQREITKLS